MIFFIKRYLLFLLIALAFVECKEHTHDNRISSGDSSVSKLASNNLSTHYSTVDYPLKPENRDWYIGKHLSDTELKIKYKEILLLDQQVREEFHQIQTSSKEVDTTKLKRSIIQMTEVDRHDQIELAKLIYQYGWPSQKKYGDTAALAAWNVAMHAPPEYIEQFINLIKKASTAGENTIFDYVTLQDRLLYKKGEKQYFGAFAICDHEKGKYVFLPIENMALVNLRRKRVGLPPLNENQCEMVLGANQ